MLIEKYIFDDRTIQAAADRFIAISQSDFEFSRFQRLSPYSGVATGGLDGALHRDPQAQGALETWSTNYKLNYWKLLPLSENK